jgi:hypothetical protein
MAILFPVLDPPPKVGSVWYVLRFPTRRGHSEMVSSTARTCSRGECGPLSESFTIHSAVTSRSAVIR